MKWLISLLLLLNVALFGYFRLNATHPVGIGAGHEAIHADKIKIVTAEELAALPKKTVPPPADPALAVSSAPAQLGCYEWGSFSKGNITRAKNILEKFSVESELRQTDTQEARRYWIYIQPLANAEKAQAKIDELRALGIEEIFIVQEAPWRNAISLGVFKDESLATKLLEDLRGRGIKTAIKGVRNHESGQSSFFIKNISDEIAAALDKLRPDFSGSELKKVACQ